VELKTRQRFNKSIVIREAKRIDICNQLANLEGLEFYVNEDGIPVLRTEPTPASGLYFLKVTVRLIFQTSQGNLHSLRG